MSTTKNRMVQLEDWSGDLIQVAYLDDGNFCQELSVDIAEKGIGIASVMLEREDAEALRDFLNLHFPKEAH